MTKKVTLGSAIYDANIEEVKKILANGFDVTSENGLTPLMLAIRYGYKDTGTEIFDFVLDNTTDLNVKDVDGYTALSYALSLRKPKYASKILRRDVDVNVPCVIRVAPHPRAYDAYLKMVLYSQNRQGLKYPQSTLQQMSPLCVSIYKGYDKLVPRIVHHGADLDYVGGLDITALSMAVRADNIDVLKYLLSKGANPNVLPKNWKEYESNPEVICPVALKKALKYGCYEAITCLLDAGSKMPSLFPRKDNLYSTPLTYLLSQPKEQLQDIYGCIKLLQTKTDITLCDSLGRSALSYALENNVSEYMLHDLVDDKINNLPDKNGLTPMYYAFKSKNYEGMKFLYDLGVPMGNNKIGSNGKNLLMLALESDDNDMVSFMLKFNPSLLDKDKSGKTVLDYIKIEDDLSKKIRTMYTQQEGRLSQNFQRKKG